MTSRGVLSGLTLLLGCAVAHAGEPEAAAATIARELATQRSAKAHGPPAAALFTPPPLAASDVAVSAFSAALVREIGKQRTLALVDQDAAVAAMKELAVRPDGGDAALARAAAALGAPLVLATSVTKSGDRYQASARLVVVADGTIAATSSASFGAEPSEAATSESRSLEAQLRRLADRLARGLDALDGDARYQRFAVLPFEEVGTSTKEKQLGLLVASELTTMLQRDHALMMVERAQIAKIVDELALSQTGLVEAAKSSEVGRLAGAQGLVVGTVSEAGDRYLVNARVASVEDGHVVVAESMPLPAADLVSLSSEAVVLRTRAGSIYRSILLPGWGQSYNRQPVKGALFAIAEAAAGGLALAFHLRGNDQQQRYRSLGADSSSAEFASWHTSAQQSYRLRNIFLGSLLVVHAFNILDALTFSKSFGSPAFGGD